MHSIQNSPPDTHTPLCILDIEAAPFLCYSMVKTLSLFCSSFSHQIAKRGTKSKCRLFPIILWASAHKEGIFNLLLGPRFSRTNKVPTHLLFRSRPTRHETVKTLILAFLSMRHHHLYGPASGSGLYFYFFLRSCGHNAFLRK